MHKVILFLCFFFSLLTGLYSQTLESKIDVEYSVVCLVDSIDESTQIEFNRIYHINRDTFYDKTFDFATNYVPIGDKLKRCDGLPMVDCCKGGQSGFNFAGIDRTCTKINFDTNDNAFNAICPDNWTVQDLVDVLNEGNPNGATFQANGEVIEVVNGTPPSSIWLVSTNPQIEVVISNGEGCKPSISTKDCNSDDILSQLEAINSNTCTDRIESNVFCSSSEQLGLALVGGGTVDLTAGQEILITRVLDCNNNPQSFSVSVLISGELVEIEDPVDAGECPTSPSPPLELGCIKDEKGVQWQIFQSTLNGITTTFYSNVNGNGTPSGDPNNWTGCDGVDFECKVDYVCANGQTLRRMQTIENGETKSVIWQGSNNTTVTAPPVFTWGECAMVAQVQESVICADGEEAVRVTKYDRQGNFLSRAFEKPDGTNFTPTTFNDCVGGGISVTTNDLGVLFAYGQHNSTTQGQVFNSTITRTNVGRYTVTFGQSHPRGSDYTVTFGQDEPVNTRDVPKLSVVDGTKTINGFQVQSTVDDNGGAADPYVDEPWSFHVSIDQKVVTDVQSN